ncbi:hypothetical protein D6779_02145 [Candidatus Parcubacteria bacterium]|nr:MAG: hypothetical protein D6779_02145 [Candidatus Parcubacteria bacterium]
MGILKWIPTIFLLLAWYAYASLGATKCERVERSIQPLTGALHFAYTIASAWVDSDTKLELLEDEYKIEQVMMKLAAHQFYPDEQLPCIKYETPEEMTFEDLSKDVRSLVGEGESSSETDAHVNNEENGNGIRIRE